MQKGLTLLELLLVMSIMGVVFGLGLGAFASLDSPDDSALGLVRSTLRTTSNQAQSRDTQARVVFEKVSNFGVGQMRASELFTAGTWNFDDGELTGAFGNSGVHGDGVNLRVADDGFIGKALSLGEKGAEARFDVRADPAFDPSEGFVVEFAMRPDPMGNGAGHVLNIGLVVGVDLMPGGGLRGWIAPNFAQQGQARKPGQNAEASSTFLFVEAPEASIAPGRWSRVRLEYDRKRLAIDVDGRPFERLPATLPVRELAGDLVLSKADRQGYRGDIDKLVISLFQLGAPIALPEGVTFTQATPKSVVFSGGGLDPELHRRAVEIGLHFEDIDGSHERSIRVNLLGTVE